jgi:hypothetical protein
MEERDDWKATDSAAAEIDLGSGFSATFIRTRYDSPEDQRKGPMVKFEYRFDLTGPDGKEIQIELDAATANRLKDAINGKIV